jgi:hypothetical protein
LAKVERTLRETRRQFWFNVVTAVLFCAVGVDSAQADDPAPMQQLPPPSSSPATHVAGSPDVHAAGAPAEPLYQTPVDAPLGFTGRSGVLPSDVQTDPRFIPVEDRWRIGFPDWDRYGKGFPPVDDYPYIRGYWWDPYNQNALKGDYPILGQHVFLNVTGTSKSLFEYRQVPIPTTPFESTENPNSYPFLGRPNQFMYSQFFALSLDLFHGDAAFKPFEWRVKVTPIFNINYLAGQELGVVRPDVRRGLDRGRTFFAMEEWFLETKLTDIGPNYDFISLRAGAQPFNSDFRGFIFSDINRGVRLFGNRNSNREQYNLVFFDQLEKDTNSGLNSYSSRDQMIAVANYYVQDFIFPGYTTQWSVHYNHDDASFKFDKNDFLVRPDPVGVFTPHNLDVVYLGWAGDGHINRLNVNHAFYWALGRDSRNPLAGREQEVNAQFGAIELSYDRDWVRFRTSFLYASGDENPRNSQACGFDGIFDNPAFAGGEFSYWQRQSIRLFGVNVTNRESLFANLRSSKTQGQSNFVNPGLLLYNVGADFEITPKCRLITNANFLWFDHTEPLKVLTFQERIDTEIGTDLSAGLEIRPYLNNNVIINLGAATLLPGRGFRDLYDELRDPIGPLFAAFVDVILTY